MSLHRVPDCTCRTPQSFFRAIICAVLFFSSPIDFFVHAEALTGAESDLELPTSSILSGKHFIQYGTQRTRADSRPKHWNRMSDSRHVIGTERSNDLTKFYSDLPEIATWDNAMLGTDIDNKFFGRSFNRNRRMLQQTRNLCTNKDISISQGPDGSPGMPHFSVQIVNTCMSGCAPSQVHVYCGWFASASLVNPNIFQRLAYNDCLVNGGRPLKQGEIMCASLQTLG
ncbi:uncharacterized protein [Physcomitrium patens]|uniref:uncharacterized protein isoform X2 n=1 Tax=Physcomitrium patens TaxID=3218 RepID=UPI000D168C37|nr:uncharacterized protein LOC112294314 isoform X2 [Physcomitrium patens]|eukprot:XP_024400377.1 uncharacterized protein LOC112294314 isoform X2 [Physcomitrella patens]